MSTGASSKILQIGKRIVFVISKWNSFFIEKEYVSDNFALERKQENINSC